METPNDKPKTGDRVCKHCGKTFTPQLDGGSFNIETKVWLCYDCDNKAQLEAKQAKKKH